ncbi:MAG: glycosyltransferase family 4 protein, partial [Actinobacteria bacterium]|nr:glycosyltransferase family 4 protein [Actinomycetota bacterium]
MGFLEPHLRRYGGIRRVLEISNRLVDGGHRVTIFVPEWERQTCDWMRCAADVRPIPEGYEQPLDVLVFNHEPQWHLVPLFERARITVLYALHYSKLYGKAGSWESLRLPVDLRLANSTWTADMVEQEIGVRPHVLLGGINPEHFHPVDVPKRYPILTMGSDRDWKGTDVVEAAASQLGLPLETYAGKDLPQSAMAREYASAEVFVVGSYFEGFGQPGLEALACGTPLVTTDNGGCRDYAIDRETALVVPPGDVDA